MQKNTNSNQDWTAIVFGTQPANDNAAPTDNVSSDTESNATEQTLSPEVNEVTAPHQVEVQPQHVEVEQVEQSEVEPQLTLNQKIDNLLTVFNDTSKDIRNTIDGRDTSTKFILEKLHSDLMNLRMVLGNDADHNQFNRYELKLAKLVYRMDNLETVLHSRFSENEINLSKQINGIR